MNFKLRSSPEGLTDNPIPRFQWAILAALSRKPAGSVYAGTANRNKVAASRRRTRLARASRKANR